MDKRVKGRRKVGICGSRLVISAISASLQENPAVEVQLIEDLLPNIIEEPVAASPDVILFDIATAPPQFAIRLVNAHPAITLIGVDLAKNEMVVLYGKQRRLLTTENLMQAIRADSLVCVYPGRGRDPSQIEDGKRKVPRREREAASRRNMGKGE